MMCCSTTGTVALLLILFENKAMLLGFHGIISQFDGNHQDYPCFNGTSAKKMAKLLDANSQSDLKFKSIDFFKC